MIGDSGEWQSTVGELGPADFVCNEHDPTLDWMVGYNEIVVNETKVSGQDKLTIWLVFISRTRNSSYLNIFVRNALTVQYSVS